jgi:hypothetical protein
MAKGHITYSEQCGYDISILMISFAFGNPICVADELSCSAEKEGINYKQHRKCK